MGKKAVFATILLLLILADVASATFLWNFRRSVSSIAKESSNEAVSPNPSPAPVSGEDKSKDKPVAKPPSPEIARNGKEGGERKDKHKANEPSGSSETCDKAKHHCKDTLSMVACVQSVDDANKVLVILIQNKGGKSLKVDIRNSSVEELKEIEVLKHQLKKVNVSLDIVGTQIVLNAGSGNCTLKTGLPTAKVNLSDWIPSYTKLMTPIYGAYFLLVATLVAVGVFICCKFRKRRLEEVPYQELELGGIPESASVDVETAEGWDQGWDDDWDDNKAVKSPGAHHPGSISANGLTARSSNRDGWEDWDD